MQLMTIEQILTMWEKDAPIDDTEPAKELIRLPNLHAKYLRQLSGHSLAAKATYNAYSALRRVKSDYYNGRMDQAELKQRGLEPFRFTLKSDVNNYIDSDPDILKLRAKIALHEETAEACRSIVKELNSRGYNLGKIIDWQRFTDGAG